MFLLVGELAALLTSLCWSFTSTFFTLAGRLVGSIVVNRIRLLLAVLFLVLTHLLLGQALPLGAEPWRWFWFALSGFLGLVLGDAFLFQAFVWIGPRLSMLMMSTAPIFSTLLAWLFLGERLSAAQLVGIAVTVVGIAWVVFDRAGGGEQGATGRRQESGRSVPPVAAQSGSPTVVEAGAPAHRSQMRLGLLFGVGAALGQALGYITAKKGLVGDFSALSGTLMRMIAAAAILWLITVVVGQVRPTFAALRRRPEAMKYILGGAFFGPFLGVTLSLVAVQRTAVGIASTLLALPPIFLLPISHFVFKERIGWGAIAGTLVAVMGVAILAFA